MTNNAPVYWELQKSDGSWFSLHTYAWSVKSFGGRRFTTGTKRGEDLQLPFHRGRIWVPKTRDMQVFDMNLWVLPFNEDGSRDGTKTVAQKMHENWRKIINAVDQEGQFVLRKRWYKDDSTISNQFTTGITSATALAEFIDGSGPSTDDGKDFYINLTFALTDPYFYTSHSSVTLPGAGTVAGEAPTNHVTITFTAGTNPKITFADGNWIQYNGTVSGSVVVDVFNGSATSGGNYVNGLITRNPEFSHWPMLVPGTAYPTLSGTGAAGSISYDEAYR